MIGVWVALLLITEKIVFRDYDNKLYHKRQDEISILLKVAIKPLIIRALQMGDDKTRPI